MAVDGVHRVGARRGQPGGAWPDGERGGERDGDAKGRMLQSQNMHNCPQLRYMHNNQHAQWEAMAFHNGVRLLVRARGHSVRSVLSFRKNLMPSNIVYYVSYLE